LKSWSSLEQDWNGTWKLFYPNKWRWVTVCLDILRLSMMSQHESMKQYRTQMLILYKKSPEGFRDFIGTVLITIWHVESGFRDFIETVLITIWHVDFDQSNYGLNEDGQSKLSITDAASVWKSNSVFLFLRLISGHEHSWWSAKENCLEPPCPSNGIWFYSLTSDFKFFKFNKNYSKLKRWIQFKKYWSQSFINPKWLTNIASAICAPINAPKMKHCVV